MRPRAASLISSCGVSSDLPARTEPPPPPAMAKDLASARPDQLIAIDRKGDVQSPARYRWRARAWYASILGLLGLLNLNVWFGFGPLALVFAGPFTLWAGHALWRARQLKLVSELVRDRRLEEAEREAQTVANSRLLPRAYRGIALSSLSTIARYRGDHELALERIRRARTMLRSRSIHRRISDFGEVVILVNLDRLEEARTTLAQRRDGPDGEVFRLNAITAELYLALAEGHHAFEEDQLHAWGRYGLGLTLGAALLALVGWAFAQRGDADMAEHLLTEAADRWDPAFSRLLPLLVPIVEPYMRPRLGPA